MKITPRETILGMATVGAALYAGLIYLGSGQLDTWRLLRTERAQLQDSILRSKALVEERSEWETQMESLQALMPMFPRDKQMDVHWLSEVEGKAAKNELRILRHEVGNEQQEGPIYEMPVYCRRWEGSLDALVHFLFDLQGEGAMLDVRYLHIKPKDKVIHDGRFDLFCAYRREGT
jgi:hypothetical protein